MSTFVLAPTVSPRAATVPAAQIPDDPFHDSRLKFVGIALFLFTIATLAGLVGGRWSVVGG